MVQPDRLDAGIGQGPVELRTMPHDPLQAVKLAVERLERAAAGAQGLAIHHEPGAPSATGSTGPVAAWRNDSRYPIGSAGVQTFNVASVHGTSSFRQDLAAWAGPRQAAASGAWQFASARSKRSAFITFAQAATKSLTNFSPASADA